MSRKAPAPGGSPAAKKPSPTRISIIDYDETSFDERETVSVDELASFRQTPTVTWISVRGLADDAAIDRVGEIFGLHPLVVQDIRNTGHRPRLEDMVDYVFLTVKEIRALDEKDDGRGTRGGAPSAERKAEGMRVEVGQVSIVVGRHFVLSFEEDGDELFEPIREKLRKYKGRIRKMGTDYLAYRLLDAIVDGYFGVLEGLGERVEELQEKVVTDPNPRLLASIQTLRTQMAHFYRSIWPLREVVGALNRDDLPNITKGTATYFRDVYEHTVQIIETMETDRDMISGMLDIYVSSVSNKMNEVMKILTIIATIFIPMTFLAGVYGMNFKYMPEYDQTWAYPVFWLLMVAIAVVMLLWFHRKKWL